MHPYFSLTNLGKKRALYRAKYGNATPAHAPTPLLSLPVFHTFGY